MENLDQIQDTIIKNIKDFRQTTGLSQGKLADKADVGRGYLAEIESRKAVPSLKTLIKIANALNVKLYRLFLSENDIEDYNKKDLITRMHKALKSNLIENLDKTIDEFLK